MKFTRNAKLFRGQPDVAPFAGVFFLLVLFLLLNSSLVLPTGLQIQLPAIHANLPPGIDRPTLVVAVDQSGQFFFDHQIVTLDTLQGHLARVSRGITNLTLVVQADKSVDYDVIVQLSKTARDAGVADVLLALRSMELPEVPEPPKQ